MKQDITVEDIKQQLNLKGTLEYFIENTFNYPTLAEACKVAALDAWNRMPKEIVNE